MRHASVVINKIDMIVMTSKKVSAKTLGDVEKSFSSLKPIMTGAKAMLDVLGPERILKSKADGKQSSGVSNH